jgi:hypothetical protein
MPANKADFHGQIIYHGSPSVLHPGDIIEPQRSSRGDGLVWGTTNPEIAEHFGQDMAWKQSLESGLPQSPHHVYQVEKLDPDEPRHPAALWGADVVSAKGFRVVNRYEPDAKK